MSSVVAAQGLSSIVRTALFLYNICMSLGVSFKANAFYHLYLSGEHPHVLFESASAYEQFLQAYATLITPVADTYAYCLLPNHFHFFIRVRTLREQVRRWVEAGQAEANFRPKLPQSQFDSLFTPYRAQLQTAPTTIEVTQRQHFTYLIRYIHQNPTLHNVCDNFRDWRYSSYLAILSGHNTRIPTKIVMRWFHSVDWFEELHWEMQDITQLGYLIVED